MRDVTLTELERLQAQASEADVPLQMDEDAFAAFYARTSRVLWRYLARLAGDRQAADDLLQECYFRFLRSSADYESEEHRRNALFHIGTNLVRDRRRREAVRPWLVPDAEAVLGNHPAAEGRGRTERAVDLERAMSRLRPRERAMLWLAYGEGSTHREIAEVLGVKSASVKPLLFRARRRLAELLGGRTRTEGRDE